MHTGRLLAALQVIVQDYRDDGIQASLQAWKAAADQAASAPTEASHQTAFTKSISELRNTLKAATANGATASVQKAIRQAGLESIVGSHLLARANGILSRSPFMLQEASADIGKLVQSANQTFKTASTALSSLENLGFVADTTADGEYELGVLIPTAVTDHDLIDTNTYLKGIQQVVSSVHETIHGKAPSEIKIRSAASGTFELYLALDAQDALAIATLATTLIGGFLALKKAKAHREATAEYRYPQKTIDSMKDHEATLLEQAKEQAVTELLAKKWDGHSDTHVNQLRVIVTKHVDFLAKSINHGVDLEVSPPPHAPDDAEASDERGKTLIEVKKLSNKINQLTLALEARESPIAELPSPVPVEKEE